MLVGFDEACHHGGLAWHRQAALGAAGVADAVPTPSWPRWHNIEWAQTVQQALLDVVMAYLQTTQADAQN